MATGRSIVSSRLGRLSQLGRLAGGIAGGMVSEGARRLAVGDRPSIGELALTPANVRRLGERLSEMRGAAMKVGQLLSMDSGQLLPPQLSELLDGLREDAHPMPLGEVADVLKASWGRGWESNFERFNFQPIAAASIGQVHEAVLKDGRRLAIKLQYPGVRRSIDSDVDNVATLLRAVRMIPDDTDLQPLFDEAKKQLHLEADYTTEAISLQAFARRLCGDARFEVPGVIDALCTGDVLAMRYLEGEPIERLAQAPREERDRVAVALTELALQEVFEWGLVQTDPNFANYMYDANSRRIQLLDFGAVRTYSGQDREAMQSLLSACLRGDHNATLEASIDVGYLSKTDRPEYCASIIELLHTATRPGRADGDYRFGDNSLAREMSDIVLELRKRDRFARVPPASVLFLHRKLGGLYLLLSRLHARVPVRDLLKPYLKGT